MQRPYAAVSLSAIRSNLRALARAANAPAIAVLKDDAYGHGAEHVAHALGREALLFAVSCVAEGVRLRAAGADKDILVLTPLLDEGDALRAQYYDLIVTAASPASLARAAGCRAHLALNTGMNRYGVPPQEAEGACRRAVALGVRIEGVYSHLYDAADGSAVQFQTRAFREGCLAVCRFFPRALRHLCATGGILAGGAAFDAVRPGLGLYGYAPPPFENTLSLAPAMKVYACVSQETVPYGGGAGYGAAPKRFRSLHTLCAGYGDGFFRAGGLGAVGNLCMDACVREGRLPVGTQVCVLADAAAYAAEHGTTAYEVLCALRTLEKRYDK